MCSTCFCPGQDFHPPCLFHWRSRHAPVPCALDALRCRFHCVRVTAHGDDPGAPLSQGLGKLQTHTAIGACDGAAHRSKSHAVLEDAELPTTPSHTCNEANTVRKVPLVKCSPRLSETASQSRHAPSLVGCRPVTKRGVWRTSQTPREAHHATSPTSSRFQPHSQQLPLNVRAWLAISVLGVLWASMWKLRVLSWPRIAGLCGVWPQNFGTTYQTGERTNPKEASS